MEEFIEQMMQSIEMPKKTPMKIRIIQIEALDNAFQTIDFRNPHAGLERLMSKVKEVYERASKLRKTDELAGAALKLMTTILIHGPEHLFLDKIDNFLDKPLLKGVTENHKKKQSHLECILKILRGRYLSPREFWRPHKNLPELDVKRKKKSKVINRRPSIEKGSQKVPDPLNRSTDSPFLQSNLKLLEDKQKLNSRLQHIFSALFSKKQKLTESVDIYGDILLQISAHRSSSLSILIAV